MRSIGALLVVIAVLALAFGALSYQADGVRDRAVENGTNQSAAAYNLTTDIVETTGQTLSPALIIGGFAAVAFLGVGLLVAYGPRGR